MKKKLTGILFIITCIFIIFGCSYPVNDISSENSEEISGLNESLKSGGTGLNGTYRIRCEWGNLYLNGSNVVWDALNMTPLNTGWASQEWTLQHVTGNVYRLKCEWGGLYLNGSDTVWAYPNMAPLNPIWDSQCWIFEQVGRDTYRIKCSWGNLYLNGYNTPWSMPNMAPLNTSWASQNWILE